MSKICKCDMCGKELVRKDCDNVKHHFCNVTCKGQWQVKQREDLGYTKEWLYEQYVVKRRTANDIAKEVHRDPKRVWDWLKEYGIETRNRGYGNTDVWFEKGKESKFKGKHHTDATKEKFKTQRLKDGHVPYLVNGKHWLKQNGMHPASWKGGVTPERQSVYSSKEWKESVKEVWKRENATCQLCGKKHNEDRKVPFHIHHLYTFAEYPHLRTNVDNLVLLCKECHLFVHSNANTKKIYMLKNAILPTWLKGVINV